MPDIPLSASDILACLHEVADELPRTGPRHTVVVVGGSLLDRVRRFWDLVRGRVYGPKLAHFPTEKYLVVSKNSRNRKLDTALAVRLTTTRTPPMDSIVPLSGSESFAGSVLCDDIVELWEDEVTRDLGAVSYGAMQHVNAGLAGALGL